MHLTISFTVRAAHGIRNHVFSRPFAFVISHLSKKGELIRQKTQPISTRALKNCFVFRGNRSPSD